MLHTSSHQECPPGCCTGTEILCVSIPCPVTIVLLGLRLRLELPCVRLTSESPLTGAQVDQLLGTVRSLLGGIAGSLPTATAEA